MRIRKPKIDPDEVDFSLVESWRDVHLDAVLQSGQVPQFPHCDSSVLHAPGECEYCDGHEDWQVLRHMWGINFTGHRDPTKQICPAEARRELTTINAWQGNVAETPVSAADIEEATSRLLDLLERLRTNSDQPDQYS